MRLARLIAVVSLCRLVAACSAGQPQPITADAFDFPLQPPRVAADFLWHQKIVVTLGEKRSKYEVYVGKQDDTLSVVGLTPLGTTWLEIVQRGLEVTYRSALPDALPFPPRAIIEDIQRSYFPFTSDPPLKDGTRRFKIGQEEVEETWSDGELKEREFHRGSTIAVKVLYERWPRPGRDGSLVLVNERFGYQLEISTIDMTADRMQGAG